MMDGRISAAILAATMVEIEVSEAQDKGTTRLFQLVHSPTLSSWTKSPRGRGSWRTRLQEDMVTPHEADIPWRLRPWRKSAATCSIAWMNASVSSVKHKRWQGWIG